MTPPIQSVLNSPPPIYPQPVPSLSRSASAFSTHHSHLDTQPHLRSSSTSSSSTSISSLNNNVRTPRRLDDEEQNETPVGAPMILINGFPCTGKLTIAAELSKLIPAAKVLDKHILINTATTVFEKTDVEYQILRKALRSTVLHAITTSSSNADTSWIFTESQSSSTLGTSITHEYLTYAKQRRPLPSPFISIIINCSLEENIRRLQLKTPTSNPETLKIIRNEEEIHKFGEWAGVYEKELDVTDLMAVEAAKSIASFVEEVVRKVKDSGRHQWQGQNHSHNRERGLTGRGCVVMRSL